MSQHLVIFAKTVKIHYFTEKSSTMHIFLTLSNFWISHRWILHTWSNFTCFAQVPILSHFCEIWLKGSRLCFSLWNSILSHILEFDDMANSHTFTSIRILFSSSSEIQFLSQFLEVCFLIILLNSILCQISQSTSKRPYT